MTCCIFVSLLCSVLIFSKMRSAIDAIAFVEGVFVRSGTVVIDDDRPFVAAGIVVAMPISFAVTVGEGVFGFVCFVIDREMAKYDCCCCSPVSMVAYRVR